MTLQEFTAIVLAQYPARPWQFRAFSLGFGALDPTSAHAPSDWDRVGYCPGEAHPWAVKLNFVEASGATLQEAETDRQNQQRELDTIWADIESTCTVGATV